MKRNLFGLLALLTVIAVAAQVQSLKPLGKKKKLLWSEEFNYTGLPDSSKWSYEVGFVQQREAVLHRSKKRKLRCAGRLFSN